MSAIVMHPIASLNGNKSSHTKQNHPDYDEQPQIIHAMYHNRSSSPQNLPSSMISVSYTENTTSDPKDTLLLSLDHEQQRHQSNINQKEDIIPPKKMKKVATVEELQMVVDHFEIAKHKDMEAILALHEPQVLSYRDKVYLEAAKSGITADSNDFIRLKILSAVVDYAYMNIVPVNEYTAKTDRKHFKEVASWATRFAKNKGVKASLPLIYSAWCHDIERFIPSTKCEYLPESVDRYRKQIIHGVASAKVACCLLKNAPVTEAERTRIFQIVLHHDLPNPREDVVILGQTLVVGINEDFMEELSLLMDADSFAFFQSTIRYFILFKSKKNSPDWIWQRIKINIKRLQPYLRHKAAKCVHELPLDLQSKVAINYEDLAELCTETPDTPDTPETPNKEEIQENIDFLSADNVQINSLQLTECKDDSSDSQKSTDI